MTDSRWQLQPNSKAPITEIFASIQGEGLFVGERQAFIRFADCNLKCAYCDTTSSKQAGKLTSSQVLSKIEVLKKTKIHSVSITGGEPLLYADFLKELIPQVKKLGLRIYLETNGTLPQELKKIVNLVDYVAMDIKLPSSGNPAFWKEHQAFLTVLNKSRLKPGKIFVKIILTSKSRAAEIKKAIELIAGISRHIPLVLQPVTPLRQVRAMLPKNIFAFQNLALEHLSTVKVIPQTHKLIGVR
ncbi:MAG: 7-carboxy-7-deazaguanine synthase QueE [bacterium]|nr:7-carboxy-7-deazaguanine synthase QueE [bacterium]